MVVSTFDSYYSIILLYNILFVFQLKHNSGLCVVAEGGIYAKRSMLILANCDSDNKEQVWIKLIWLFEKFSWLTGVYNLSKNVFSNYKHISSFCVVFCMSF